MTSPVVVSRIQNRRGTQSQFNALYPPGYTLPPYNGIGGYNPPGSGPIGYTAIAYPNVLMPGELALCTDSRRTFVGNISGEYVELSPSVTGGLTLLPLVIQLPPVGVSTPIPALTYLATPFFTILYDVTDSLNPDWNIVGTTFSRNGDIKITAVVDFGPGSVSLVDASTDVNTTLFDISFTAAYNGPNIEISYIHNFPGSLTFSSSTIIWLPI